MSDPLPPAARVGRQVRLFHTFAGVLLALVGLIATVIGGVLTASRTWPSATGTVGTCEVVSTGSGSTRSTTHRCEVSWMDGDRARTMSVDVGRGDAVPGTQVTIRYKGGTAVVETSPWVGAGTLAVGLVLLATGGFVAVRSFRKARAVIKAPLK